MHPHIITSAPVGVRMCKLVCHISSTYVTHCQRTCNMVGSMRVLRWRQTCDALAAHVRQLGRRVLSARQGLPGAGGALRCHPCAATAGTVLCHLALDLHSHHA